MRNEQKPSEVKTFHKWESSRTFIMGYDWVSQDANLSVEEMDEELGGLK